MGLAEQNTEIEDLKASFTGKVKVISDVGDFTNVITVYPADKNIQIKFQLTDSYPETPPTISVVCNSLNEDQLTTLVSELTEETFAKQSTLSDIISKCFTWFEQNDITIESASEIIKSTVKSNKKGKQKKEKKRKTVEETVVNEKKPPMKTSLDVIKRINWDEALDKSQFIVGYMDRLVGLVERPFEEFTWEDLASVDHYCLAIPQHRIQYFKYKNEKVWDKNERLDNVFGSTGSKVTIIEAMASYEAKNICAEDTDATDDAIGARDKSNNDIKRTGLRLEELDLGEKECVEPPRHGTHFKSEGSSTGSTSETASPTKMSDKCFVTRNVSDHLFHRGKFRYNFFVAIEITNKSLIGKLKEVQAELVDCYPQYGPYKIPENGFHLTLALLSLGNIGVFQNCVLAMDRIKARIVQIARQSAPISFTGLDSFGTNVLFAEVNYSKHLLDIVDLVKKTLADASIDVDKSLFNPHLTLFKAFGSAKLGSFTLNKRPYENMKYGEQLIDNIQVCRMGTLPKLSQGQTGFYTSVLELNPLD